jgi:hypothetical protein
MPLWSNHRMAEIRIEQALYGTDGPGGYQFLARSPGFAEAWLPDAERLCTGFGERPAGVACPGCIFARPLGREHVAVVQVADRGADDAGRPGALGFRLLVLSRRDYAALTGDPFLIADRYPPSWTARGDLPPLQWEGGPPPRRTAADVQRVLQRAAGPSLVADDQVPRGGSHVMLGGCQALVDGARLVFERPAPDTDLLRDLWTLLPSRVRCELWPASFAFGNALHFDAVVVPRYNADDFPHYKTEAQVADYPEGKYEYGLQHAAETNNQADLDSLFYRRSSREAFRLVVILLVVVVVLALVIRLLPNAPPPPTPATPPATGHQRHGALDRPRHPFDNRGASSHTTYHASAVGSRCKSGTAPPL